MDMTYTHIDIDDLTHFVIAHMDSSERMSYRSIPKTVYIVVPKQAQPFVIWHPDRVSQSLILRMT